MKPALRILALPALATLLVFAVLAGLGTWQLQRLAWKTELLATVEQRRNAPATPMPAEADWPHVNYDADEYRHVSATGRFRHDLEAQVYTLVDSGPGFWVLTPLVRDDGSVVIVNRGFVPTDRRAPAGRAAGQIDGEVTVTGLLRMPEEAGMFMPDNAPATEGWYRRDPAEIAAARGLARVAPFLIDADATANPDGLPQGGLTRIAFPNRHLEYALTWFGLAGTLLAVFAAFAWSRLRAPKP